MTILSESGPQQPREALAQGRDAAGDEAQAGVLCAADLHARILGALARAPEQTLHGLVTHLPSMGAEGYHDHG